MKRLLFWMLIMGGQAAMAVEEAAYEVVTKQGRFEVRAYAPQIVAEVLIDGTLEEAGDRAFRPLFRYIDGDNRGRAKIAMTAPVAQEAAGEQIAMTAPVSQERAGDRWAVRFVMPAGYTLESLPEPDDPAVTLHQHPARRVAAVRYSGFWSEKNYRRNLEALRQWMNEQGLAPAGEPVWARYNPPFTPWFLRRNEILIPLALPP